MKTTLRIFPLLLFTLFSNTVYSQESLDLYEIGVAERGNGYFSNALTAWLDGKDLLEIEGKVDPRIGIAYIELAAELNDRAFYDIATGMYMWGFSGISFVEFKETLTGEVERIKPLLEEDVKKEWNTLLDQNDPLLLSKIRGFWFDRDLTPATPLNERLIEHWERIVYARNNFTKNKHSPYGTDDRGTIYVRFGKPTKIRHGRIDSNVSFFPYPFFSVEYEFWVYEPLSNEKSIENIEGRVLYFFGKVWDSRYKLWDSVEELIPARFVKGRNGSRVRREIYNHLTYDDEFFEIRVRELGSKGPLGRWFFLNKDKYDPVKLYGPKEKTSFEYIPVILSVSTFRQLDENNIPVVSIIMSSVPDESIYEFTDDYYRSLLEQFEYDPAYTLIVRDENWNELDRYTRHSLDKTYHLSTYILDPESTTDNMSLSVESNIEMPAMENNDSLITLPFLANQKLNAVQPLSTDISQLELSDLITGIKTPDVIKKTHYPYPVFPDVNLDRGENLEVYMEIYNLMTGSGGRANYRITVEIESRKKEGIFSRIFQRIEKDIISVSSSYSSETNRAQEHVSFDISDLEPAEYEFRMTVTDLLSGQKKARIGTFIIVH